MATSNAKRNEASAARLQREGWDVKLEHAYDRPRIVSKDGRRDVSPRLTEAEMRIWLDGFIAATQERHTPPEAAPAPTDDPNLQRARDEAATLDRKALIVRLAYLSQHDYEDYKTRDMMELASEGIRGFTQMSDAELREEYANRSMLMFWMDGPQWEDIDREFASWGEEYGERTS